MKRWGAICWKHIRRGFRRLKPYEWIIALLAIAIGVFGVRVWFLNSERSIDTALNVAEPIFVVLGTLSIILLWAQFRETNIWNRLLTYHQFFSSISSSQKTLALREAFAVQVKLLDPPSAYEPLSPEQAKEIFANRRSEDGKPNAKSLLQGYLNDYEQFCGAINCGLVDEDYARELRGTRVIDAYFGFAPFIDLIRQEYENVAKQAAGKKAVDPFTSKFYLELQLTATRWLEKRQKEFRAHDEAVAQANERAEKVRKALIQRGVAPKARNRDGD